MGLEMPSGFQFPDRFLTFLGMTQLYIPMSSYTLWDCLLEPATRSLLLSQCHGNASGFLPSVTSGHSGSGEHKDLGFICP